MHLRGPWPRACGHSHSNPNRWGRWMRHRMRPTRRARLPPGLPKSSTALPDGNRADRTVQMHLALVASHPVQYQAPLFRELARRFDLTVFFAHRATPQDQADAGFGVGFDWDVD